QAPAAISAIAGDNCDGAIQPACDSMLTLTSANLGTANGATLSCTASDASKNNSTCSATFVLVDNTPPGITLGSPSGTAGTGGAFCNDAPVSVPFAVT